MSRLVTWFDNNFSGKSTTGRWGFMGVLIGINLFLLPLTIYLIDKGDIIDFSSTTYNILGIITLVLLISFVILTLCVVYRWWKKRLHDTTEKRLKKIESDITKMKVKLL